MADSYLGGAVLNYYECRKLGLAIQADAIQ
jgi:hypothetical protein